jgi:hypothetical protein
MITLDQIQKEISARYDISNTAIASTSNEYARRTTLINIALRKWADEELWKELLKSATLTVSNSSVTLPTDIDKLNVFLDKHGYIQIGSYSYRLVTLEEKTQEANEETRVICWIDSGVLHFAPNLTASTITLRYKTKNKATDSSLVDKEELEFPSDFAKIPKGDYLVNWVLSDLYLTNDEVSKAQFYRDQAQMDLRDLVSKHYMQTSNMQILFNENVSNGYEIIGEYD